MEPDMPDNFAHTLTTFLKSVAKLDTKISKSNLDLRGLDRKCRCAATMSLPSLGTTKQHELKFTRCCMGKTLNRALSSKYCRTLSYTSRPGAVYFIGFESSSKIQSRQRKRLQNRYFSRLRRNFPEIRQNSSL